MDAWRAFGSFSGWESREGYQCQNLAAKLAVVAAVSLPLRSSCAGKGISHS